MPRGSQVLDKPYPPYAPPVYPTPNAPPCIIGLLKNVLATGPADPSAKADLKANIPPAIPPTTGINNVY